MTRILSLAALVLVLTSSGSSAESNTVDYGGINPNLPDRRHWVQTPATGMADVGITQTDQIWLTGKNGTIWYSYEGQYFEEEAGVSDFGRIVGGNKKGEAWSVGRDNHTLWYLGRYGDWKETKATDVADVAVARDCPASMGCNSFIWIVGTNGTIWYSDDQGRSFNQIKADGFCRVATHSTTLWAVGCDGSLWHYTRSSAPRWDAGTWEQTDASGMVDAAADENDVLWLVGQNGSVWRSTNGKNFMQISPPAGFVNIAIGKDQVYAVRADGTLWRYSNQPIDKTKQIVTQSANMRVDPINLDVGPLTKTPSNPATEIRQCLVAPCPPANKTPGPVIGEPGGFAGPAPTMTGTFDSDFGVLTLGKADGSYAYKYGRATITHIYGDFMDGTWSQSQSGQMCADGTYRGHFHFRFASDGFTGQFGYCDGPITAGQWNGKRR